MPVVVARLKRDRTAEKPILPIDCYAKSRQTCGTQFLSVR